MRAVFLFTLFVFFAVFTVKAQHDSTKLPSTEKQVSLDSIPVKKDSATKVIARKDSILRKEHVARKATIRSAIIPGWGQAYNHEYWKIPIVYAAIGVPAGFFVYNNTWYQRTKTAYNILVDSGDVSKINPKLQGLSAESLQYYRNSFRKNRDYSILFFLFAWGLNVADATVFAQLKDFNVSGDLSMHVEPDYNPSNKTSSLSFVFNMRTHEKKALPVSF